MGSGKGKGKGGAGPPPKAGDWTCVGCRCTPPRAISCCAMGLRTPRPSRLSVGLHAPQQLELCVPEAVQPLRPAPPSRWRKPQRCQRDARASAEGGLTTGWRRRPLPGPARAPRAASLAAGDLASVHEAFPGGCRASGTPRSGIPRATTTAVTAVTAVATRPTGMVCACCSGLLVARLTDLVVARCRRWRRAAGAAKSFIGHWRDRGCVKQCIPEYNHMPDVF